MQDRSVIAEPSFQNPSGHGLTFAFELERLGSASSLLTSTRCRKTIVVTPELDGRLRVGDQDWPRRRVIGVDEVLEIRAPASCGFSAAFDLRGSRTKVGRNGAAFYPLVSTRRNILIGRGVKSR